MMDADRDRETPSAPSRPGDNPGAEPSDASVSRGPAASPGPAPAVDIQSYIGAQLRAVYDDIAKQPIPDRFLDLMRRLE